MKFLSGGCCFIYDEVVVVATNFQQFGLIGYFGDE
jgi:hypothetical protein